MAHPYKAFRKRKKAALAVLGVIAIGGFVVFPTMIQMLSSSPVVQSVVVKTKKLGNLKRIELQQLDQDRPALGSFFRQSARMMHALPARA